MGKNHKVEIITLPVHFDIRSIPEVEDLWEHVIRNMPDVIGVDCTRLRFIDSSAIGALVKFYNSSVTHGIDMHLFNLSHDLSRIFETTKIIKLISVISKDRFFDLYFIENPLN